LTLDLVLALFLFAFVSSLTPGPNNIMLLSSGLTFGFRPTIPHMAGVVIGHSAMVLVIGLGLGQVFERLPWLYTVLKVLGAGYMLYLAWKIASSGTVEQGETRAKPLTFLQAALFQWVNPKGVVMAVSVVTIYTAEDVYTLSVFLCALAFFVSNTAAVTTWTGFGSALLRRFLSDPLKVRWFNWIMAGLLILSLIPMLWT